MVTAVDLFGRLYKDQKCHSVLDPLFHRNKVFANDKKHAQWGLFQDLPSYMKV